MAAGFGDFRGLPYLSTIPIPFNDSPFSPVKGCASFNERVPKTKKHRLQTVLYLNAKLTQTSIILGFYIVSIFAYLSGGGGAYHIVSKQDIKLAKDFHIQEEIVSLQSPLIKASSGLTAI